MERLNQKTFYAIPGDPNEENHVGMPLSSSEQKRMQEAREAKEKMHGRMACGRPLVVRLASEKGQTETTTKNSAKIISSSHKSTTFTGSSGQTSRSAKITAIKNKLKALEEEGNKGKKQKKSDCIS